VGRVTGGDRRATGVTGEGPEEARCHRVWWRQLRCTFPLVPAHVHEPEAPVTVQVWEPLAAWWCRAVTRYEAGPTVVGAHRHGDLAGPATALGATAPGGTGVTGPRAREAEVPPALVRRAEGYVSPLVTRYRARAEPRSPCRSGTVGGRGVSVAVTGRSRPHRGGGHRHGACGPPLRSVPPRPGRDLGSPGRGPRGEVPPALVAVE